MVLGSYFFTRPKKHISEYDFRHVMAILCISLCTLSAGDTRYGRWSAGVPVEGQRVFLARAGGGRNRRVAPHLSAPHQGGALWVILLPMYSKLLLILDPEDPFELEVIVALMKALSPLIPRPWCTCAPRPHRAPAPIASHLSAAALFSRLFRSLFRLFLCTLEVEAFSFCKPFSFARKGVEAPRPAIKALT